METTVFTFLFLPDMFEGCFDTLFDVVTSTVTGISIPGLGKVEKSTLGALLEFGFGFSLE
jgi:hypothetical protein